MSDDKVVNLNVHKSQGKTVKKCPLCSKPVQEKYQPFCSKRCADLDLGQWLGDGYRIPSNEAPGDPEGFDDGYGEDE